MANDYDLVILGGGMGGYVAAIRAAQLNLKTAIVEQDKLGGTCLHRGCIPSKSLLKSAEVYKTVKNAKDFGISTNHATLDFSKVQTRKKTIVEKLYKGILYLMNKGKIDVYEGTGRLLGPSIFSPLAGSVSIEMNNGTENQILVPKNLIIATGSRPRQLKEIPHDNKHILSSDDALELESLPASITIIGGGAIGIEWASMLTDFGVKVTILEYAEQLLPTEDKEISDEMSLQLKKRDVQIVTDAKILSSSIEQNDRVKIQVIHNGEQKEYVSEKVLVCVGREAAINDIGLENTEIEIDTHYIKTNENYQTAESHIYAVGDCIGGLQLAHVASKEGITAVEHIAGLKPDKVKYEDIPRCVYSSPEIASVGLTEKESKAKGYHIKTGKFPFHANGKALIHGEKDGFVKFIVDAETNDLLGVHMIGHQVTDLISEAGLAKVLDATPWEISQTVHPHPSLSEIIFESALSVDGLQLHS